MEAEDRPFGLGIGSRQLAESRQRRALAAALRRYRCKGAPAKQWRIKLRAPMLAIMAQFPEARASEIARFMRKHGLRHIGAHRTIQNWLSEIRRGGVGYGRRR
jgi:hypothetical protein